MNDFLKSIEISIETKNWYSALAVALTIPDICGWVENPNIKSGVRYKAWCDRYLVPKYTHKVGNQIEEIVYLSAEDCYALRCAYLHEGADDITRQNARKALTRFGFSSAGAHGNLIIFKEETFLNLTVTGFCADIISAGRQWLQDTETDAGIKERLQEFVVVHTAPYQAFPGVMIDVN